MFDHLNVNSRRVICSLCNGKSASLESKKIDALEEPSRGLLALLALNLNSLQGLHGGELIEKVTALDSGFNFEEIKKQIDSLEYGGEDINNGFQLGKIKACSFRGLAPTGREWKYDFDGQSHLIYGPNGSGKSSLLGAICWCLTGKIFRDDCSPCEPERITAYPIDRSTKIERDDAQSLMDEEGNSSPITPYWVEIELFNGTHEVTLRRSSNNGLAWKTDGTELTQIQNIREAGIDDLDCEMRVLTPASVSHMKFGKNPDLIRLLAEITGYGSLESIAGLAEVIASNSRSTATRCCNRELTPQNLALDKTVDKIDELADAKVKDIPSYERIRNTERKLEDVEEFSLAVNKLMDITKAQLASDLGLEIPAKESDSYKDWEKQSNNLPGLINGLFAELDKSMSNLFANSLGLDISSQEDIIVIEEKLNDFEERATSEITERLGWAIRELENTTIGLKLKAAGYLEEGSNACPVCTQSLENVPHVKEELERLKGLSDKKHIQKELDDFWRYLSGELHKIVPLDQCNLSSKSFGDRIVEDWNIFKDTHCKELLRQIAEQYDDTIDTLAGTIPSEKYTPFELPETEYEEARTSLSNFTQEVNKAKSYVALCKNIHSQKEKLQEALQKVLIRADGDSAFKNILERAKKNNDALKILLDIHKEAGDLYRGIREADKLRTKIASLRARADNAEPIKNIKTVVRNEVKTIVNGQLGEKTKSYYESLYDNDVLTFNQLTTGHAANPDLKDQINIYLKAGGHQVPMAPYSNAGRMRALLLSFTFALLEKSPGSLDFILLDDPALSLDDEHKARFVDKLVGPFVESGQVVLGTHYERFFKDSEPVFNSKVKLLMVPKKRVSDSVNFETYDLLEKVRKALDSQNGNWREIAGDIRIWIERTLDTISGYCPEPFTVFNNIPQTITNYKNIVDPRIATGERDLIVDTLRNTVIARTLHKLHHDESINEPDVRDAFWLLAERAKTINSEIERYKELYNHSLYNRQIRDSNNVIINLACLKDQYVDKEIHVVREAAAAHNKQGINWDTNEIYPLNENSTIQVCSDIISPIAECGQYVLLGNLETEPENGDLVAIEAPDSQKYLRRFWRNEDGTVILEGANPTRPFEPVQINLGNCKVRRVSGVLYKQDEPSCNDAEWSLCGFTDSWFDNTVGVRVNGTSLEPVARDGQIVLINKRYVKSELRNDTLVCVSIKDIGDVIKRCHVNDSQYIFSAINPNDRESPIITDLDSIYYAYELKGVLFEVGYGTTID